MGPWVNSSGQIIEIGGVPVECNDCPCEGVLPPCCNALILPATATGTYTINALAPKTVAMARLGSGYYNPTALLCDLGDGHTQILLDVAVQCGGGSRWNFAFTYAVYVDGILSNFVLWQPPAYTAGSVYPDFAASCSPLHIHYEGTNTSGNDADGATLTCGGVTYPFTSLPGIETLVFDLVP